MKPHTIDLEDAAHYDRTLQWAAAGTLRDTRKRLELAPVSLATSNKP